MDNQNIDDETQSLEERMSEEIINCINRKQFQKKGLTKDDSRIIYCTYHFPEQRNCPAYCCYRGDLVEVKINDWFTMTQYECLNIEQDKKKARRN